MLIVLIGFMGCGKSTVAHHLSGLLAFPVVEMDALVHQKTGTQTMQEVFAKGGELLLRETEIALAKEYSTKKELVISTGGGAVLNKIIIDYFKRGGAKVVYLEAAFETIAQRLKNDTSRPLFGRGAYDARLPLYERYADLRVNVNTASPEEIALQIQREIYGV